MKKSILLSIILSLSLVACIPQAMAQKQSRMEKLLRYLNDNDTEKWQKNREKVDNDTKAYYAEELALLDVLNGLWNEQSEQAATDYFGCYGKAANATSPTSVRKRKYRFRTYRTERNRLLSTYWRLRKNRYLSAVHCWTVFVQAAIRQTPLLHRRYGISANWLYWKVC